MPQISDLPTRQLLPNPPHPLIRHPTKPTAPLHRPPLLPLIRPFQSFLHRLRIPQIPHIQPPPRFIGELLAIGIKRPLHGFIQLLLRDDEVPGVHIKRVQCVPPLRLLHRIGGGEIGPFARDAGGAVGVLQSAARGECGLQDRCRGVFFIGRGGCIQ